MLLTTPKQAQVGLFKPHNQRFHEQWSWSFLCAVLWVLNDILPLGSGYEVALNWAQLNALLDRNFNSKQPTCICQGTNLSKQSFRIFKNIWCKNWMVFGEEVVLATQLPYIICQLLCFSWLEKWHSMTFLPPAQAYEWRVSNIRNPPLMTSLEIVWRYPLLGTAQTRPAVPGARFLAKKGVVPTAPILSCDQKGFPPVDEIDVPHWLEGFPSGWWGTYTSLFGRKPRCQVQYLVPIFWKKSTGTLVPTNDL